MGVIVNELEVIAETPAADAGGAAETAAGAAEAEAQRSASGSTPDDVRCIVRHHERRRRRLWAH
jgi:hypothetical protein